MNRQKIVQKKLLDWYQKNKRDFPWRLTTPNPYYVWISEIMLQQTTTTAVVPYFLRFIEKYPTLESLKKASLDDVYLLWQGLGYYSRAKNLHKSAQMIDTFPNNSKELCRLPGIGDYTSKAIAAIAFEEKVLPLDGNIKRVMARFFGLEVEEAFLNQAILERITVEDRPGDFCQAVMDLARKLCLPKNPLCHECPLNHLCSKKTDLPFKKEKPSKKRYYTQAFLIKNEQGIFLTKSYTHNKLLKGLWNVPLAVFSNQPYAKKAQFSQTIKHIFTHIDLRVDIYQMDDFNDVKDMISFENSMNENGMFVQDISTVALSTLTKKIICKHDL